MSRGQFVKYLMKAAKIQVAGELSDALEMFATVGCLDVCLRQAQPALVRVCLPDATDAPVVERCHHCHVRDVMRSGRGHVT